MEENAETRSVNVVAINISLPLDEAEALYVVLSRIDWDTLATQFDVDQASSANIGLTRLKLKLRDALGNPHTLKYKA
jgi:hypothetical protein